jgi:hypothetical protein
VFSSDAEEIKPEDAADAAVDDVEMETDDDVSPPDSKKIKIETDQKKFDLFCDT